MTTNKIIKINNYISTTKQMMCQGQFKNDYVNLYKYLVGYSLKSPSDDGQNDYWKDIKQLQNYFEHAKHNLGSNVLINKDDHWTYVEMISTKERPYYRELLKFYVPVAYTDLALIARAIFNHLFAKRKTFFLKVAHQNRTDNICIWVMRSDFDNTCSFLQSLKGALLPAPLFCPEYKGIGITRELNGSFNEIIADNLFKYICTKRVLSFDGYIKFIESKYDVDPLFEFDKTIVLRSLKCIATNQCPVTSGQFSIVDY